MADPYLIVHAPQADADLDGIIERIAKRSPQSAKRVLHRILANVDSLKTFPNRTVVRGRGGSGKAPVRTLPVQSWIIFFRVLEASGSCASDMARGEGQSTSSDGSYERGVTKTPRRAGLRSTTNDRSRSDG